MTKKILVTKTNLPCSPEPERSPEPEVSSSIVFEDAATAAAGTPSGAGKLIQKS